MGVVSEDWEVLYFNDDLEMQSPKLSATLLLSMLEGKYIAKYRKYEMTNEYLEYMHNGGFPFKLSEIDLDSIVRV